MQLTFGEERDAGPILALTMDSCGLMFNAPLIGEIVYARPNPHGSALQGKWLWITPAMMRAKAHHEARVATASSRVRCEVLTKPCKPSLSPHKYPEWSAKRLPLKPPA